jgi:Fe-S-cluster-containing dehydrogenase component
MTITEEKDGMAKPDTQASRRELLSLVASATVAGLVVPAVLGQAVPTQAAAPMPDGEGLSPLPDLPEPVAGEDPILRMLRDLRRALKKPMEQRRWIMVVDLRKCTGCFGCTLACVTENKLPPGIAYRPVLTETRGKYPNVSRRFIPTACVQCDRPPCISVCPVSATWKRGDGIVVIDYDKCIGCRYCIAACPYSARYFDSGYFYSDFEGGEPQPYETVAAHEYRVDRVRRRGASPVGNARKCHFCIHRIEKGELPACTVSCMGRATHFGDANDPESLVAGLIGQPNVMRLKQELGTEPKFYYLM